MRAGALIALLISEGVKHHTGNLAEAAGKNVDREHAVQHTPVPPRFATFMARIRCEHLSQEFCSAARNPWCACRSCVSWALASPSSSCTPRRRLF